MNRFEWDLSKVFNEECRERAKKGLHSHPSFQSQEAKLACFQVQCELGESGESGSLGGGMTKNHKTHKNTNNSKNFLPRIIPET